MVSPSRSKPAKALRARARIVGAGYTITSFAREKGFSRSTVKAAIRGERHGKQSKAVLAEIFNLPLPR
jgi:predicted transcriptional regulator